jgi:pimeloyl-ACP methyl ester carboxylesterase
MSPSLVLPDGRDLSYDSWGDPDGLPLLCLHGTPGCRLTFQWPVEEELVATGARIIAYDRPGYGRSSRHPGRRVVDCVADVTALLDHLGVDRFAVLGGSGGGPHCLAVAALLPDRVIRAKCDVGVAPYGAEDLEWLDGMDRENVKEFGWTLEGEKVLVRELEREEAAMRARVAADPASILGDFDLPEADKASLAHPVVQQMIVASVAEQCVNGVWGWVDDDLAFLRPRGFDLADIAVPVEVWYGETDVMVPAAHGRWLARRVPGADVHIQADEGHMGDVSKILDRVRDFVEAASH